MRPPKKDKLRKNKIGFLDDHTLDYYRRVYQTITSDIDGDEKELFLNNVFSQLETEAIRVCQNQTASRFIERLLVDAKPAHILQLLTAFSNDWATASQDRFASHVLQNLIALSPKCVTPRKDDSDDAEEEKTARDVLFEYYNFVLENLETVLTDTYGSHILRVLLEVLGGVDVSTDIIRSRMSKTQCKDDQQWPRKDNPPEEYNSWFRKLVKKLFSLCDYSDHLMDPSSCPVYQTILLILKIRDVELCQKYINKIIKKTGLIQEEEEEKEKKDEVLLPPLVQNEVGSYLVEQIIALSVDTESQSKVYTDIFKGRLLYFGVDSIANFILQKFIDTITDKELFEEVFDELSKYIEDILAIHHIGILTKMAAGCIRVHTRQEKFVKVLMEAFHCASPEQRQKSLAALLLTLSTYEVYFKTDTEEDDKSEEKGPKPVDAPVLTNINYHGSVLIQNLLRFGKTKLLVTSLLELKPVELKTLSCDRCGSHVIDVFCESGSVGEKKRDLLLQKLKGLLIDVGCDRNGSRTLEAVWKNCSVKQKILIAEELSKHEDRLRSSNFGHFLHRNFSISLFKSRRSDWTTEQGIANKKRKLFKDFLNDSGAGSPKVARVEMTRPDKTWGREEVQKSDKARVGVSDQKLSRNMASGKKIKTKEGSGDVFKKNEGQEEEEEVEEAVSGEEDEEAALKLLDILVKKHGLGKGEEEHPHKQEKKKQKHPAGDSSSQSYPDKVKTGSSKKKKKI